MKFTKTFLLMVTMIAFVSTVQCGSITFTNNFDQGITVALRLKLIADPVNSYDSYQDKSYNVGANITNATINYSDIDGELDKISVGDIRMSAQDGGSYTYNGPSITSN